MRSGDLPSSESGMLDPDSGGSTLFRNVSIYQSRNHNVTGTEIVFPSPLPLFHSVKVKFSRYRLEQAVRDPEG